VDRNLLLAVVLSTLVIFGWQAWMGSMRPEPPTEATQEAAPGSSAAEGAAAPEPPRAADRFADLPGGEAAAPRSQAMPSHPGPGLQVDAEKEAEALEPATEIAIDRELYDVVLSSRGGALTRWELDAYTDEFGDRIALVDVVRGGGEVGRTPFSELGRGDLSQAIWRISARDENGIVFAWESDGVELRKTWQFEDDSYAFRLRLDVVNRSSAPVTPRFLVEWPARVRPERDFAEQALAVLQQGELRQTPVAGLGAAGFWGRITGGKPTHHEDHVGEIEWAGVQNTYFVSALLPDDPRRASARFAAIEVGEQAAVDVFFDAVELAPGQSLTREYRGYAGPKEMDRLEAIGGGIERAIDLGWSWFAPITRGFVWLLHVLYTLIPNYGVAIILLTLLVRVVTAPLTVKQMRSMERLRRVQPRMKEIQEKYASDRQKQSEELMKLYRQEKVNPLGGCLPMVLQLPVFIGLFYALRSSIELRHAPFFGWIDDLSAPEVLFTIPGLDLPVRVLPLIMGATMYLQQKITPVQTPDPMQARMMLTIMPVMMTVLFYQFASGLVLYWMMSNVLAILHQLWIGRNVGPPTATADTGRAAAKPA
jgi:YidC/Oxa1 family membrane protein insertase